MTFTRYFKLSSYCLIASGFVAIAATGRLDPFSLLFFPAAMAASCFLDTARLHRRMSGWIFNSLALAYLPFYLFDYRFLSRSFVISTIHMVFFAAALKILTIARDRDYLYLYIISFIELLAAATLTIDTVFALAFILFLLSGVSTLMLFELRRSNARAQQGGRLQPVVAAQALEGTGLELFSRFPAGRLAWVSVVVAVMIVLLAIPLFFLLPRTSLGIMSRPSGRLQLISGFSEKVELGAIGSIKESDAVVMRVKVNTSPAALSPGIKWRGIALDHFDGRVWSQSNRRRYSVTLTEGRYIKLEEFTNGTDLLFQTFFLEPLSTNVIFASRKVLAVSRDVGILRRDFYGSLYIAPHSFNKVRYIAVSDPSLPDPEVLDSSSGVIPENVKENCLQLPPLDPRIGDLARSITRIRKTAFEKASAVQSYLLENYTYSLSLSGQLNSRDPLAVFLFDVRHGHCEYFASAMAIMLREVGIPSRLVNGFRRGEYNSLGDDWTVRQYDAHSWVEVYLPPIGWYEFDPTPPDPKHSRSSLARLFANLVDAVDLWWWEDVVNFDFWKQYRLVGVVRSTIADCQRRISAWSRYVYETGASGLKNLQPSPDAMAWALWLPALIPPIVILFYLYVRRHPGFRNRIKRTLCRLVKRPDEIALISGFYAEALEILSSRGFRRRRGQTPLELAQSLGSHPAAAAFLTLTDLYNRVRFGLVKHEGDDAQAQTLLRALRKSFSTRPSGY